MSDKSTEQEGTEKTEQKVVVHPDGPAAAAAADAERIERELELAGRTPPEATPTPSPESQAPAEVEPEATPSTPETETPSESNPTPDARDAEIARLKKLLQDEDGQRGGRLQKAEETVRQNIETMMELMKRNAELTAALTKGAAGTTPATPAPPPKRLFDVPQELRENQPELVEALDRAEPVISERVGAAEARATAAEKAVVAVAERLQQLRYGQFCDAVRAQVKDYDDLREKPEFKAMLAERPKGVNRTWGEIAQELAQAPNDPQIDPAVAARQFVETIEAMREHITSSAGFSGTPAAGATASGGKPLKPPASAQRGVDRSMARSTSGADSTKQTKARLQEVETKLRDLSLPNKERYALEKEFETLLVLSVDNKLA